MVRSGGFEPPGLPAKGRGALYSHLTDLTGVPGRVRTCDLRLRKPTLYPTELRALKPGKADENLTEL